MLETTHHTQGGMKFAAQILPNIFGSPNVKDKLWVISNPLALSDSILQMETFKLSNDTIFLGSGNGYL